MDKNKRICIIGGGPAGVAAAMYLEVKGYRNYRIFEKEHRVGGKSASRIVPGSLEGLSGAGDDTENGSSQGFSGTEGARILEAGVVPGAKICYALRELEKFGGVTHGEGPADPQVCRDASGRVSYPFHAGKNPSMGKALGLLRLSRQLGRLEDLMKTKYQGCACYGHVGLSRGEFFGLSKEEDNHLRRVRGKNLNLKDLVLPFEQFCRLNGLEEILKLWKLRFTAPGYGFFDEIPAAYVLKYLEGEGAFTLGGGHPWIYKEGIGSLFEAVNLKLSRPAILDTEVTGLLRTGEEAQIRVRDLHGERTETFDAVIVTCALDRFAAWADVSGEERELFGRIRTERSVQALCSFPANASPEGAAFFPENISPERLGHGMMLADRILEGDGKPAFLVWAAESHDGSRSVSEEEAICGIREDLAAAGFPVEEVLYTEEFRLCPHVGCTDYAEGWYDRLEALQGTRNTWYAGEILSFGDPEDTCAGARDLIGRYF